MIVEAIPQSATVDFTNASFIQPKPIGLQTLRGFANLICFVKDSWIPFGMKSWRTSASQCFTLVLLFDDSIYLSTVLKRSMKLSFNCNFVYFSSQYTVHRLKQKTSKLSILFTNELHSIAAYRRLLLQHFPCNTTIVIRDTKTAQERNPNRRKSRATVIVLKESIMQ